VSSPLAAEPEADLATLFAGLLQAGALSFHDRTGVPS
jgi:hypothetical protein